MPRRIPMRRAGFRRRTGARKLNRRQRQEVKRIVGRKLEDKFYDAVIAPTGVTSGTGFLFGPFGVPGQGDTVNQRSGDVITQRKHDFTFQMNGGDATNVLRVIIFKWHPNNSADTPSAATILQDTVTLPHLSRIQDFGIEANRFKILSDRLYSLVLASDTGVRVARTTIFGRRLGRKKQVFNPANTTGTNHVYVLAVSDSVAAPNPTLAITSRVHYTDA